MAKIKPFCGVHPNPYYVGDVVLELENLSLSEAKIIRQENPYSFVNMLVPKLDNLFLRGSKNELAFKQINENFQDFIDKGIYLRDNQPSLYIYRISNDQQSQTGLWTVTSVDDYLDGSLKKHEHTRPEREEVLVNYLQQTGIDANPVLITYRTNHQVSVIIAEQTRQSPLLSFEKNGNHHQLWTINDEQLIRRLQQLFAEMESTYIADGHHRAAAACLHARRQRALPLNSDEAQFFTSVYMPEEELRLYPFHRMVKDLNGHTPETLYDELSEKFEITRTEQQLPEKSGNFGMYLSGAWHRLSLARQPEEEGTVSGLDVSILQDQVLEPILGIEDPRTSERIDFPGANIPLEELTARVDRKEWAVLFTLYPVNVHQLRKIADSGEIMPPKSTLFSPKFQAGLLIHEIG